MPIKSAAGERSVPHPRRLANRRHVPEVTIPEHSRDIPSLG